MAGSTIISKIKEVLGIKEPPKEKVCISCGKPLPADSAWNRTTCFDCKQIRKRKATQKWLGENRDKRSRYVKKQKEIVEIINKLFYENTKR